MKDPALQATMKVAIRLICVKNNASSDAGFMINVLGGLRDFYNEFPRDKLGEFNTCLAVGIYQNFKGVVCSENHDQFKQSTFQIINGLFNCEEETGTSLLCKFIELALNSVFHFIEQRCGVVENIEHLESQLIEAISSEMLKDYQQNEKEGLSIRKRQYDLLNMIKLIRHIVCKETNLVAFARTFFARMNYSFLGEYDDFVLDFAVRIAANAGCCIVTSLLDH